MTFDFSDSPYPVRADLQAAYQGFWEVLPQPGTWWTGAERVAIAAEVRQAPDCEFCKQRAEALSPQDEELLAIVAQIRG